MSVIVSVREQVLREIRARLGASESPAENAFRAKLDQIEPVDLPCYDIEPGEQRCEDPGEFGDRGSVSYTLPVTVRAIVNADVLEGQEGMGSTEINVDDSALDPFYVFAVQQLVGGGANLGGLALRVAEVSAATVFRPGGADFIGLEMKFEVQFATRRGDPSQKG